MRRLLAVVLPVVAALGVLPAVAAPVTTTRLADVEFDVPVGDDATMHVHLYASHGDAGDRLDVTLASCARDTCSAEKAYAGALPTGALALDAQQASGRLRLSLSGLPLQVTWQPQLGTGVERGYVDGGDGTTDVAAGEYRGDAAVAEVVLAGRRCQGRATVGTEAEVNLSGTTAKVAPLTRLRLSPTGAPRCAG